MSESAQLSIRLKTAFERHLILFSDVCDVFSLADERRDHDPDEPVHGPGHFNVVYCQFLMRGLESGNTCQ
jgi:hypothetical protein